MAAISFSEDDKQIEDNDYIRQFQNEYNFLKFDKNEEQITKKDYYPGMLLNSLVYLDKPKTIQALNNYDYIITHTWDINNDNWYGAISAWYDAFELWDLVSYNTLPSDLGGAKIALLFPDCPDKTSIYKILFAILSKYKINEKQFIRLCQDIYFIHKPKELIFGKGKLPYEKYSPSNLIFVDGKLPKDVNIICDNIYLSIIDNLKEEEFKTVDYNFLFIYRDKRIFDLSCDKKQYPFVREITIARSHLPNTLIFDDIRRINFNTFKEPEIKEDSPKKRILLYMTEKNKRNQLLEDSDKWTDKELNDIIDTIPKNILNPLAIEIEQKQKELFNFYKDSLQKKESFTKDQIIAIKEKGTIFGNGFNETDVISEESKIHFVIVGLTEKNRDFEEALIRRSMLRGINISTEIYLQNELPIPDIHSKYDWYMFTPMYKWCTSRFIPEALYHKKKILLTKEAKNTFKWNLPLNIRYHDSIKYLMFIGEDDVFKKPRSLIANHIIGNW